jgi:hypothetical protein
MNKSENLFKKLQNGLTPNEKIELKKGLKDLKRKYEEVFGKSTVDLEPFLNQIPTIQGGGSKRRSKRRKSNRKKKSMRGGNNSTDGGGDGRQPSMFSIGLLLCALYYFFTLMREAYNDHQENAAVNADLAWADQVQNRYYQDGVPYPPEYVSANRFLSRRYMPGRDAFYTEADRVSAENRAQRRGGEYLRQGRTNEGRLREGISGFGQAVERRDRVYQPGGVAERFAGLLGESMTMREAQREWDDDLSHTSGAAGGGGGGGGNVETASDNLLGSSESGYN